MLGIVLNKRDFRENDVVVSIYSRSKGKKELVARGAKKIESKNASSIETCALVNFDTARGKQLNYLTKADIVKYFSNLRKDFEKSLVSQYAANLVDKVVRQDKKNEKVFSLFLNWLDIVNSLDQVNYLLVDSFILKLFSLLGFQPTLDNSDNLIGFYPAEGRTVKSHNQKENIIFCNNEDIKTLRNILRSQFKDIANVPINKKVHKMVYEFAVYHSEQKIVDWKSILA